MVFLLSGMHSWIRRTAVGLAALGSLGTLWALPADNPYVGITNRNAFGIRPPPEPEPPPVVVEPPPAPPNIFLTGVSDTGGRKKAYFAINRPGGKTQEYETIAEGEELDDLKVLEVDARAGKVRALVAGREVALNFADNGLKSVGGAPAPGAPGVPGRPGIPQPVAPVPAANSAQSGPVVIGRGGVNLNNPAPQYTPAQPATYSPGNVNQANPYNAAAGNAQVTRSLPTRPGTTPAVPIQDQVQQQPVDPVTGRVPLPLPPPTRFNPEGVP